MAASRQVWELAELDYGRACSCLLSIRRCSISADRRWTPNVREALLSERLLTLSLVPIPYDIRGLPTNWSPCRVVPVIPRLTPLYVASIERRANSKAGMTWNIEDGTETEDIEAADFISPSQGRLILWS